MFLNRLGKKEKIAFLELAHHIARSDNNFSEEEKTIIDTYCFEMQLEDIIYNKESFSLEENLAVFENKMSKNVVLLELMALIYSDNIVEKQEQEIIDTILAIFNFNASLAKIYAEWTKSILAITAQGQLLLEV